MPRCVDLTRMTFGRLKVLAKSNGPFPRTYWICLCACGRVKRIRGSHLQQGKILSCGCLVYENFHGSRKTHGKSKTRIHRIWTAMRKRCYNPTYESFHRYGGRGIAVCREWDSFEKFYADMGEAYRDGLTLDRVEYNGNYCKENCRWATMKEQNRNRVDNVWVTIGGRRALMRDVCSARGVLFSTVSLRILRGEDANDEDTYRPAREKRLDI